MGIRGELFSLLLKQKLWSLNMKNWRKVQIQHTKPRFVPEQVFTPLAHYVKRAKPSSSNKPKKSILSFWRDLFGTLTTFFCAKNHTCYKTAGMNCHQWLTRKFLLRNKDLFIVFSTCKKNTYFRRNISRCFVGCFIMNKSIFYMFWQQLNWKFH